MASAGALKRKLASPNTSKFAKRSRTTQTSASKETSFRFLDLPTELRNTIYNKVTEDSSLVISRVTIHHPASISSLSRVNRQIRSEFLSLTHHLIPAIETEVRNWDFGHVIRFLNRITDKKLDLLRSGCTVLVNLSFSGNSADPAGLMRWLDRFGEEKRGTDINFEYARALKSMAYIEQNWVIAGFRACTIGGPQGREQFDKIREALLEQERRAVLS